MLRIVKNPNEDMYNDIKRSVLENNGYCPCSPIKTDDTKCPCKKFREQNIEGECHCGLYVKIDDEKL